MLPLLQLNRDTKELPAAWRAEYAGGATEILAVKVSPSADVLVRWGPLGESNPGPAPTQRAFIPLDKADW